MNAVAEVRSALPSSSMSEAQLIETLQGSLYPGASEQAGRLVLNYCRAAGFDPMLKPVHIVPMSVKTGDKDRNNKDVYANRDVIMPGIGLYRITATRTGEYAGIDEPIFGPVKTTTFKKKRTEWGNGRDGNRVGTDHWEECVLEYPEWAKITVYRLVGGEVRAYTAIEFWLENYATASKDSEAPNAMWAKRPRGQLVKCVEAQALRKAFPEVGSQPTAEEMEGREIDMGQATVAEPIKIAQRDALPPYTDEEFAGLLPAWRAKIAGGTDAARLVAMLSSKRSLSDVQAAEILKPLVEVMAEQTSKPAAPEVAEEVVG